ncbi:MAG: AAA family ATPase [Candidatus Altiarchaeota archaeon]|nr:AAA family ATPase [Candidatus Altiarchaeota archaeon]
MVERVSTGITGLDETLGGGYPKGRNVLLIGSAGTGKTTFALQFIHDGAKRGEKVAYLSLEQKVDELKKDVKTVGLDFTEFEKKKLVTFYDQSFAKEAEGPDVGDLAELPGKYAFNADKKSKTAVVQSAYEQIFKKAKADGVSRFVVDSIPALAANIIPSIEFENEIKMRTVLRKILIKMCNQMKECGFTSIFIAEAKGDDESDEFGIASYVTDGVIILKVNPALDTRIMAVKKMRATSHSTKPQSFAFTREGIVVNIPKKTQI